MFRKVASWSLLTGLSVGVLGGLTACAPAGEDSPAMAAVHAGASAAVEELAVVAHVGLPGVSDIPGYLDPESLAGELDPVWNTNLNTAALVVDSFTGEPVYEREADTPMVPASSLKILTALAALEALGAEHTFSTAVLRDEDKLILSSAGDSLLGTEDSDAEAVSGRAGLGTLATQTVEQLEESGARGTIDVSVDVSRYSGPAYERSWQRGIVTSGNIAPVESIATFGGRAVLDTGSHRVANPAEFAGQEFVDRLNEAAGVDEDSENPEDSEASVDSEDSGLRFRFTGTGDDAPPAQAQVLTAVESAPVADVVGWMLSESDNQVAEVLGRETALAGGFGADYPATSEALLAAAKNLGVSTQGMVVRDASGLSDQNRLTARQLVAMISVADTTPDLAPVIDGLAVAGRTGTLEHRLASAPTVGTVLAKTGTLDAGISLTGTTETVDGRSVWFAFLTSGQDSNYAAARLPIDEATARLTACGCAGSVQD